MRLFPILLVLGLAACDSAGPGFGGIDPTVAEVDGSRFTLRQRADVVEAIRTNAEFLPTFQEVAPKAGVAAQQMSGCRAEWVMGDPAMMLIGLSCGDRPAPKMPKRPRSLFCTLEDAGQSTLDLTCS